MKRTNPGDLLFGAYRRQVLGFLLSRPDANFHVREIARLTGVPAGSLHRELRQLEQAGLLRRMEQGNQVRYSADAQSLVYHELAGLLRKTAHAPQAPQAPQAVHSPRAEYAVRSASLGPGERDAAHLWDMLMSAREAHSIVEGISVKRLLKDRIRALALERALEVLGEAARRVSVSFKADHAHIDWRGIIGQGDVLAHEYGNVDHVLLFDAARRRIPPLIAVLERLVPES